MKRILSVLFLAGLIAGLSGCLAQPTEPQSDSTTMEQECRDICAQIQTICPNLITEELCNNQCLNCPQTVIQDIQDTTDCQIIEQSLAGCFSVKKEKENVDNNCDAACNNYVDRCLTLVPNADQDLFQEGYDSCMEICPDWNEPKIDCMAAAQDCPSMTEVCGL